MRTIAATMLLSVWLFDDPTARAADQTFEIVRGSKPTASIVIPLDANRWTKQASGWLVEYVHKSTRATLPVFSDDNLPAGNLISVGPTSIAAKAEIDLNDFRWDDCRVTVKGNTLFLIGRDDPGTSTHDWVGPRGTCRAVLKFLEHAVNARWFLPGPNGAFVDSQDSVSVAADLDLISRPAFAYSDGRSVYDENVLNEPGKSISALANNYRKSVKAAPGGHSYYHAVSAEKYFATHPEYFAVIDGKRTGKGNHLCTSHPRVKEMLVEYMGMRYEQGLDWVSLGQEDGFLRCQCDECESKDNYRFLDWVRTKGGKWETFQNSELRNTPPERLLQLHKDVIDETTRKYPGRTVMLMCYAPTAWPSKKIEHYGENVVAELMNLNGDYIDAWKDKVGGMTGFTYWFNTQTPMGVNLHMTPREAADRIKYLHGRGFVALSVDPGGTWGLEGPVYYMMGQLLGDPSLDPDSLVSEYCNRVYGKASPPMQRFFSVLHKRLPAVLPLDAKDISADARNTKVPRDLDTVAIYLEMYPPDVLEQLGACIEEAEKLAETEQHVGWVRLSRDYFDFVNLLTRMLIAHQTWKEDPSALNKDALRRSVDLFEDYRAQIVNYSKEYTEQWFPGHAEFAKWLVANLEDTSTAYYTPWEARKAIVLEKGIRGMPMGYGTSYYYSFIREPLTLDLNK
ncbi:MAG: DUF4838 domain-containing protein [Planctomycetes bacterium]|nr:DUF4838 domain-containing protein [Planctomycetota bacterium]